jgi:hypothetical protein
MKQQKLGKWTASEVELLRELYPTHDNREISQLIGRSVCAIKCKNRHILGGYKKVDRHIWTAEEDAILRELYPTKNTKKLAEMLGLKYSIVRERSVNKLHLRKRIISQEFRIGSGIEITKIRWTDEEKNRLRDLYPHYSSSEIATAMGRSRIAVKLKGMEMKLRTDGEFLRKGRQERLSKCSAVKNLTDGIVAHYLAGCTTSTPDGRAVMLANKPLIELKRNQLLLERKLKEMNNEKIKNQAKSQPQ